MKSDLSRFQLLWNLKSTKMATPSHNALTRSPNPSTRSYDSSSVSSATSPRPQTQYLHNLMSTGTRPNAAHQTQPIGGLPALPSVSQAAFQPYTPVAATPVMGRESLPSSDSVAQPPWTIRCALSANVQPRNEPTGKGEKTRVAMPVASGKSSVMRQKRQAVQSVRVAT